MNGQRLDRLQLCLSRLDGVNDIFLDLIELCLSQITIERIDLSRAHEGALALRDDLNTLGSRIRALIKLTGQVLHGKDGGTVQLCCSVGVIHLRFGKDGFYRIVK